MSNTEETAVLYSQTSEEFRYYADDTDISEHFDKVTRAHQVCAQELVTQHYVNPWDVSAFLELVSLTIVDTRKIMSWELKNKATLKRPCAPASLVRLSDKFEDEIYPFLEHQKELNRGHTGVSGYVHFNPSLAESSRHKLDEPILLLLVSLYSEERVLQAMTAWRENKVSNSMYDFKRIVENWDSFRDVPMRWALNTIGTHSGEAKISYLTYLANKNPENYERIF